VKSEAVTCAHSECAATVIAFRRAQVDAPHSGSHQFRHALAVRMLQAGASLPEIGEVLRHRSPQTTSIYARVDISSLRSLALPWPGGAMNTLREALQDCLALRRGLGFNMQSAGLLLPRFVAFMEERQARHITVQLALEWAQQAENVQPAERARRLVLVRGFARYCSAIDALHEVPAPDLLPYRSTRAQPYL
jgi:hypothetical protein